MISLLVTILFAALVVGLIYWAITLLPIPAPFKQIGLVACILVFIIWLCNIFGVLGPGWHVQIR